MRSISISRCRAVIIVFVLMGLIAVLALTVVFLSRAGRENGDTRSPESDIRSAAGMSDNSLYDESQTTSTVAEPAAMTPVIPPPPPTPVPTADPASLPPEG